MKRFLSGIDEIEPKWKRTMVFTESALETIGQMYCATSILKSHVRKSYRNEGSRLDQIGVEQGRSIEENEPILCQENWLSRQMD